MRDELDTIRSEDDDDFDDEAESRERYPFLFDDYDEKGEMDESCSEWGGVSAGLAAGDPARIAEQPNGGVSIGESARTTNSTETAEPTETTETAEPDVADGTEEADEYAGQPDYHLLPHLPEDVLPRMRYRRYDSIFTASPAYLYFTNPKFNDRRPRLLGRFWAEGDLAVLFSDTGAGKSILATQIAQSVASGVAIGGFDLDVASQRVVYFDLELTREQFDRRYSNDDPNAPAKFPFHRNFIRSQPRAYHQLPEDFGTETEFITDSIVRLVRFTEASVVIIDNITWLNNSSQTGNAASRIMKALARIRREYGLSILVLAHTPKRYAAWPFTLNDLQGSKMIANFADSVFALGRSRLGADVRYLKCLKQRNTPAEPDDRVATLRIRKDACWLGMEFENLTDERDHIGWMTSPKEPEKMMLIEKCIELRKLGFSQRQISERLGVSAPTVHRCLKVTAE
ncbi:MAG: AAA family ATPase [Acidobacteria bacterium]|nr:AAA family ATPase [Acidobacteriota bacterium]